MDSVQVAPSANVYESPEYWNGHIGYRAPGYWDFLANTLKEIAILTNRPRSLLDLGCAYGYSVTRLRQLGIDAYGVDISKLALDRRPRQETRPYFQHAPLWKMGFADKAFDFGFSSGVLEHIPGDMLAETIKEITRVCNRGLIGVAVTDDPTSQQNEDETHEHLRSLAEWRDIFPPSFEIISDSEASWRVYATMKVWEVLCNQSR